MTKILRFRSPLIRLLVTDQTAQPLEAVHAGWTVREEFDPKRFRYNGDSYGAYQIEVSRAIQPNEDTGSVFIEGRYLAQDLDYMCLYATGRLLRERSTDEFFSAVLTPKGWTSNGEEVVDPDDWNLLTTSISSAPLHRSVPTLPLAAMLSALKAYHSTDDVTYRLASLHFAALTTDVEDGAHVLLAVALDGIRNLQAEGAFPDSPDALQKAFKRDSPGWLYGIANGRRTTRHPVTRRPTLDLHPAMSVDEDIDFIHDADLMVRYVLSTRLGIPFVIGPPVTHPLTT